MRMPETPAFRSGRRRFCRICARRWRLKTSWSATSARTRCELRACTRPSGPIPASARTALRPWTSPAQRHCRQAGALAAQGGGAVRRRRLHDDLAGDRDRAAPEDTHRRADLNRQRIWPDHLASTAPLRPAQPHPLWQPRLRQMRRALWRQRLPHRSSRQPAAHAAQDAGRRHAIDHRSSIVRWTMPKTCC